MNWYWLIGYCLLSAFAMSYGWVYRGSVGHEAGAMVPGALLGLMLCVGSGRADWHRRAVVVGLFGAAGWAWGGSVSYMEHTFYMFSDSFIDIYYAYAMIFFIAALWAGCGGAILGLGLTEPRSELNRFARPFFVVCTVLLLIYLYFLAVPEHKEVYTTLTVRHFHDGDWLSATVFMVISGIYWVVRPKDRPAAALFFCAAVAWWVGYGLLTQVLGLRLAPLHRSESWGGVLGVLITLIIYLIRKKNYAALMLCLYGCLGGGLGYVLALFLHQPMVLGWGWFGNFKLGWPAGSFSEAAFGFFMGLGVALGASRLLRGGLKPPEEDTDRGPLDVFAVFVMLIALTWINFRRHFARIVGQAPATQESAFLGIQAEGWYIVFAFLITVPALYVLYRYLKGERGFAPQSAFGKGAAVAVFLIGVTLFGHMLDLYAMRVSRVNMMSNFVYYVPATFTFCLMALFIPTSQTACVPTNTVVQSSDPKWLVGKRYGLLWALAPVFILCVTLMSMGMQDGPYEPKARKRFGPDAYWRQTANLLGVWHPIGFAPSQDAPAQAESVYPVVHLEFDQSRGVTALLPNGEARAAHRWFLKNQYIWLRWYGKAADHPERAEVPLHFKDRNIYIAWPPNTQQEGFLVFSRVGDDDTAGTNGRRRSQPCHLLTMLISTRFSRSTT
jgi:hypothetical protein